MAKKRVARLNEQLKRELTQLLHFDVKDPRIGSITITDVEVTADLYHAKVFYSVQGTDEEREQSLQGLRAASGFLRGELGRRMRIRRAPELHFHFDSTLEHAMHIERLLREARATSVAVDEDALEDALAEDNVFNGAERTDDEDDVDPDAAEGDPRE
jgi:ribosome-binding factor A